MPVPRDRYGFKKASQYIKTEQYDEWNEGYSEYLDRRRGKWMLLMKQYGLATENPVRFPPKTEKVKRYIRKGIPPEWRGAAWFWYAGGPGRLIQNPGLYRSLIEQLNQGMLSDSDREHIERDLNRTFPDNIRFKPDVPPKKESQDHIDIDELQLPDTSMIRALRRVLSAFAIHNPSIGYCQSLNFLAGLLLLFLDEDEEKTFILLNVITGIHLPGTHAKILEANVDIGVLMMCIKDSMPAVWNKIDDNDEIKSTNPSGSVSRLPTVSLATTAWFMSCYIGNLPIETVLRVWDVFFYEGSKTLFRIALTIFKLAEDDIRAVQEHMEIFQLVQTIPRRLLDASGLMEACYKRRNGFGHISQDAIEKARVERRNGAHLKGGRRKLGRDNDIRFSSSC
ncbi:RabGAP/TBC [Rhizodiscina lignyota]|uniref:RabGAP/TBC n=1 Tax=Rhizodiscina lignyota TaxID=1504668 RepID=A0A9P4IFK9_9PEZI|nr:RabGAP/TBC [Rhizodiscina lignyota]